MFYYETKSLHGGWQPVTAPVRPKVITVDGVERLARSSGYQPPIRALRAFERGDDELTLMELQEKYTPDWGITP